MRTFNKKSPLKDPAMKEMQERKRNTEPVDVDPVCDESDDSSSSENSSLYAGLIYEGVSHSRRGHPLKVRIAGAHGSSLFLLHVNEINISDALSSPAGDVLNSVLIGGGKAYHVILRWIESRDDVTFLRIANNDNGSKYIDSEGDFDPGSAGLPEDVWQMAFGKLITPIPQENMSDV
jgi:hypothetical protein